MDDIVECYCGDDEEDGLMLCCEQCKKWQHAQCVNINKFTEPLHYVCPTCKGIKIGCKCGYEADYQKSLIMCVICHKYFHKRHVNLGFGPNPSVYVCPDCSKGEFRYTEDEINPLPSFLPHLNAPIYIKPISEINPPIPKGPLYDKLSEIPQISSVGAICAYIYSNFRSIIFLSHPTIEFFKIKKYKMSKKAQISWNFVCTMIRAIEFMTMTPKQQIIQMLDHLIYLDIYKVPTSELNRIPVNRFISECPDLDNAYDYTERAEDDFLDENPEFEAIQLNSFGYKPLRIVAGNNGMRTVITEKEIKAGELICPVYGNLYLMEEIDRSSTTPKLEIYRISQTEIALDTTEFTQFNIFQQIRRGFVSNCTILPFDIGDNRYLGIFATKPIPMPLLSLNNTDDTYVIPPGSELVLPFDISPVKLNLNATWTTESVDCPTIEPSVLLQPQISKVRELLDKGQQKKRPEHKKQERPKDVNTLKSLFKGPFYIDIELESEDENMDVPKLSEDLPAQLSHFAPPGRKSWLRCEEIQRPSINISHLWFQNTEATKVETQNIVPKKAVALKPKPAVAWTVPEEGFVEVSDYCLPPGI